MAATNAWRSLAAAAWIVASAALGAVADEAPGDPAEPDAAASAIAASRGDAAPAADTPPATLVEQPIPSGAPAQTDEEAARAKLMEISCRDARDLPDSWLDRTHSYLNQRLCEPAAWFDGFFGDERALEETPVGTFFRLRNELRWDESEGFRVRVRLSANISLPGASEKLRLLLTRDEDVRGEFEPYLPVEESDKQTRIGLRYNLSEKLRSRLDADATVKVNLNSLNPVLRARYRQVEQLTDNSFGRFTQIAFWQGGDGFGTTSRADWEWYRDYDTQLRLSGQGTWSEESEGLDWRTSVTGFRQLDLKTAIRTELGAIGYTDPRFETEEYFLNFRFRRTFLRPWLFYELQPERAWVLDDESGNRRGDWRFIASIEIQFENAPAREEREERNLKRWFDWINRPVRDAPRGATPDTLPP
jgi:hypothetical protein